MHTAAEPAPLPTPKLPAAFECPACLYDLDAAAYSTCPECGHAVTEGDVEAFRLRNFASHQILGLLLIQGLGGAGICAVMGVGAGLLSNNWYDGPGAVVVCAIALGGSVGAGAVASLTARRRERAAYFAAWLRTHFWLNVAWLSAPLSGLMVVVALAEKAGGHTYSWGWVGALAIMGPLFWLLVQLACAIRWHVRFGSYRRTFALHGVRPWLAFRAAAVVVMMGSFALGLSAGALAFQAADRITPIEILPSPK